MAALGASIIFHQRADMGKILLVGPHRVDEDVATLGREAVDGLAKRLADSTDGEAEADIDGQMLEFRLRRRRDEAARSRGGAWPCCAE